MLLDKDYPGWRKKPSCLLTFPLPLEPTPNKMQLFKNQAGWTHVFGQNYPLVRHTTVVHPFARKPIHPNKGKCSWRRIRPGLRRLFLEFCSNTTIHGWRNIEAAKSLLERAWWTIVLAMSVFGCAVLIQNVYHKWDQHPVIVSFDDTPTSVWSVPFPAITVCPEAKIRMEVMNFTDDFYTYFHSNETMSEMRQDQLMAVLQICDEFFHRFEAYQEKYPNNSMDVVKVFRKVSVRMDKTVIWCRQGGKLCAEDFTHSLTEEGICFTYNGLSQEDMFNDGVLHEEYRMNLASYNSDVEAHCVEEQGFKVVLHSPDEYPLPFAKYVLLPLDRDINIAIRPEIMVTASELASYSPIRRQCYFSHERELKFFRVYNQNNCELECLTNFTLARCGCVKFSMPRSAGTRVCSTAEQKCIMEAHHNMLKVLSESRMNNKLIVSACNCMSACSSINYLTEVTQTTYDYIETIGLRLTPLKPDAVKRLENMESSKVSVYFKGAEFIGSRRNEIFGLTDFIANCGGILGLCLGASFVSLVELLYYCVARPLQLVSKSTGRKRKVVIVQEKGYERY
ncbi:pickpocket protein 28 [Culex quinquefasciatus]|uniref:pickpocket protein 28 n=1 Tax=Culex quinquefasciatus TaxID=7176 RepID=UPI0018E2DCD2|nr:pickpocket protein 28 [Culex quinquefasciatus]